MAVYGTFASVTGQTLERVLWPTEGTPRGVVQLVHGMAEHISRYDAAAQALKSRSRRRVDPAADAVLRRLFG